MSSIKQKFGKRLKELRKSRGYTQEEIAEMVNIEPPNISKIECGMHFPQPEKIEKFASALGVSVSDLFEYEHFNKKQDLINFIVAELNNFEIKKLELAYKFIYNLKLFK